MDAHLVLKIDFLNKHDSLTTHNPNLKCDEKLNDRHITFQV